MNYINNIGISFSKDYLKQGTFLEKCKLATKYNISNISLVVREDKKNLDIKSNKKMYNGNVIYNIPSISYNLNNIKSTDSLLSKLIKNKIEIITMNPTNIIESDFEWSTKEEQDIIFNNICTGIAYIAAHKITIAVENPVIKKDKIYLGNNIEQMTDIVVNSRKILKEKYNFTEKDALKYIKICLNATNMDKNEVDKWFNSFTNSIIIVKINDDNNIINYLINSKFFNNIKILLLCNSDLEEIGSEYEKFKEKFRSKNKKNNDEDKYANIVQKCIIIVTIAIMILMIYIKFKS